MKKPFVPLFPFIVFCCITMHLSVAMEEKGNTFFKRTKGYVGKLGFSFIKTVKKIL